MQCAGRMRDLEFILRMHGTECKAYYAALADLTREAPVYEDRGEFVCGTPDLCTWLLKHDAVTRPMLSFEKNLATLPLDDAERRQLAMTTEVVDQLLARSIFGNRNGTASEWFAWLSELCNADALDQIARKHLRKIPPRTLYDFMQIARSYIADIACLVAGVHSDFTQAYERPIAAMVDYMDGRVNTRADALRAAAGVKAVADKLSSEDCNDLLPAALRADIPNRTMFLIAAHESSAYLIATACLMLKRTPDLTTQKAVRAAADFDFPIQSVLRETTEDLRWGDFHLPRGRRIRIHIGAAFGGGRQPNKSFGIGANVCPGAKLAVAAAEALINNFRPLLPQTAFFERNRHTSLAARTFRRLNAFTDYIS